MLLTPIQLMTAVRQKFGVVDIDVVLTFNQSLQMAIQ